MKIIKTYKQTMPQLKLVGKRYTNNDKDPNGTFAKYWQQAYQQGGLFQTLKQCKQIPNISQEPVGAMRFSSDGKDFEYWIGSFFDFDTTVPDGLDSIQIPAGTIGVCWLSGDEKTGELYSCQASDLAMSAMQEQHWTFSNDAWFFERYNFERFTKPDAEGNVILDICAYLTN